MLRKQLVAAIGREVTTTDFTNYQRFHNRKLFKQEYQPRPFCYAIRRPDHYPEGTLSIEAQLDDGALADPIHTTVAWSPAARPMKFSIDASTQVQFGGDRFVHGWVAHQFGGYSGLTLQLVARARQFSSFILLVGSIASADLFVPKYGMIIQNKDDLRVPLILETIPTPKEFQDAIESLSPEQQRFAKGFRAMQLARPRRSSSPRTSCRSSSSTRSTGKLPEPVSAMDTDLFIFPAAQRSDLVRRRR